MRGRGGMGGMRGPGPGGMRGPGPGGPMFGPLWMRMRPFWGWFPRRMGCGCLPLVLGIVAIPGLALLSIVL